MELTGKVRLFGFMFTCEERLSEKTAFFFALLIKRIVNKIIFGLPR
jgi:hypothetical protein